MGRVTKFIAVTCMVIAMIMVFSLSGCKTEAGAIGETVGETSAEVKESTAEKSDEVVAKEKEVYVWASQLNTLPLFVNNDYVGLKLAAEELGVETKVIGPQEIDLQAFIAAIEQEIPKKPAGLMVVAWDNALADPINKAIDAGIPVVITDGDIPNSKRIAAVSTDWYTLGVMMANSLAPYIKDKTGKVVQIGIPGNFFQQESNRGFANTIGGVAPNIEFVTEMYASNSNAQDVTKTISNLITSMPDLVGIIGTDSTCGPGIAQALQETGKIGEIFGTCVDAEPEHIQAVKDGALVAAFGQKRHLMTYYGTHILYDYNHSKVQFTDNDRALGITNIPLFINTGFIVVTPDNVDEYIEATKNKTK